MLITSDDSIFKDLKSKLIKIQESPFFNIRPCSISKGFTE